MVVVQTHRRATQTLLLMSRGAVSLLLVFIALANVITAMVTRPLEPAVFMERFVYLDTVWWGPQGRFVAGVLLLVVARALMRGKRQAWWLAVGLLGFSLLSVAVSRAHMSYLPVAVALLAALLVLAPLFPNRSDPITQRRGYIALAVSLSCLALLHGIHQFWPRQVADEIAEINTGVRIIALFLVRGLLFLFLGYGVFEILRPVLASHPLLHRDEQARARSIVRHFGRTTLAHFAIGVDKSYFWSTSGRAFIAYRLVGRVAVVLGDPIGPEEEADSLLGAFLEYRQRQDWLVAMWQAGPRVRQVCRQHGLHAYKMGEEAVVEIAHFTTQGKIGAPVRHSIARAKRDGITVHCFQGTPPPDAIFAGMKSISAGWLEQHKTHTQMGFSMGRFPADWSPQLLTVVALTPQEEVQAFLTWTPLYAENGWSLDNMRRLSVTTPGTMEMLIAESIEWARAQGYERMSLGLAPLAGLGAGLNTPLDGTVSGVAEARGSRQSVSWVERSASFLHSRKLLLGNYTSLYAFKAKFQPTWSPRYLIISDPGALPRVGTALLAVHGYSWLTMLKETWMQVASKPRRTQPPQCDKAA